MLALTLEAARNYAILAVVGFIVLSIVSAVIIKNVTGKIVMILVFAGFALGVWTQRASLTECADKIEQNVSDGQPGTTSCSFFGKDVTFNPTG